MDDNELVRSSSFGEDWDFKYYVFPRTSESIGQGGFAEVHRKGEFCCKLLLAKAYVSRTILVAKLRVKCMAWVEDWKSRNGS
ncbi:hypothetical protein [Variovorax sp. RA8]|uniref:hypothetical protein n=1 Tax=Variovorax sp. (strain JCM 16519 / RA8) TaxID=662548 RepID=UPI000AA07804|nr:hypothetical protein [Variovorax sp. RA8]VTU35486.1 hypothetical protein RA8CHR_05230 [Variovorax sp. RA8]